MTIASSPTTAEQLAAFPDDGRRYELVHGELRMMSPAGARHGRIELNVAGSLWNHVQQSLAGMVYPGDTGFLLSRNPDTVRSPDVAYVTRSRLEELGDYVGYLPLAPDFVCEVVSPGDRASEIDEKVQWWLTAGTKMVLVVYPDQKSASVHRPGEQVQHLAEADTLDGADVIPGWRLPLREIFEF